MAATDPFTSAYREGMTDSLEGTPAADRARRAPRTLPGESIALGGQVITPDGARKGWVTVEGGTIARIGTQKPRSITAIQTDGVILPGLLDLHGHPEFNVFAPWEPPKCYVNRYSWRGSKPYHDLVRDPQNALIPRLPKGTQLRYAEIRALVGGVTAIQGASLQVQKGSHESMVRNVDGMVFGEHRARAVIDLPSSLSERARGGPEFKKVTDAIRDNEVDAFYIHLAEGMRDNERSKNEFAHLADELKGLTKATVIIHGSALTREQLGAAADAGSRLVWSPQSNLRLYGETTRVGDALDVGLPVALGADWLPSGSLSLLVEMKVARQELVNQGHPITARELVTMVTAGAADVAALGDKLGRLQVGRAADLVVLARQDHDAYESVCASTPADVELAMIGGDVAYGRSDWVTTLAADPADPDLEPVVAWGRRMLLDTGFEVTPGEEPTPRLSAIRQALTSVYAPVGPIWA
jgi:cytosine/adenosine deaminase-related metal-dependent hydrolase